MVDNIPSRKHILLGAAVGFSHGTLKRWRPQSSLSGDFAVIENELNILRLFRNTISIRQSL